METYITDDLEKLKAILPDYLVDSLEKIGHKDELFEVILDLGRVPTARYVDGERVLDNREITHADLQFVVKGIGIFDADNRAGIERTLHRISGIRNRRGDIVGLTCRIGRAVYGTIEIVQDMIESGQSVLILGAPGVGKTTMLREAARVLAEHKRVVIVDTSNEIGGDGDVPHPAVGRARRMQVATPSLQHEVMIEAVENHNPEVIIIDEIGRELEAQAARTIAERGVQLVATAHGQTLDNLMFNPTLSDLVGGIKSVTLSDEEAKKRGTQKAVLERGGPPTFDVLIELKTRHRLVLHEDVAAAVDALLRGRPLPVEVRYRDENGEIVIEVHEATYGERAVTVSGTRRGPGNGGSGGNGSPERTSRRQEQGEPVVENGGAPPGPVRVYAYGVARNRLQQSAKRLRVPLIMEEDAGSAQVIITLKNYYRRRPKLIVDAERRGTRIEVLRANTVTQMEDFLVNLFHLEDYQPAPEVDDEYERPDDFPDERPRPGNVRPANPITRRTLR